MNRTEQAISNLINKGWELDRKWYRNTGEEVVDFIAYDSEGCVSKYASIVGDTLTIKFASGGTKVYSIYDL